MSSHVVRLVWKAVLATKLFLPVDIVRSSPPIMAFACEAMRFCSRKYAVNKQVGSKKVEPQYSQISKNSIPGSHSRLLKLEENRTSDVESPVLVPQDHTFKGESTAGSFGIWLILYHTTCAGIVAVAVLHGWLSSSTGLAWELWVLWQQLCLWNLFIQTGCRCAMLDACTCLYVVFGFLSHLCHFLVGFGHLLGTFLANTAKGKHMRAH